MNTNNTNPPTPAPAKAPAPAHPATPTPAHAATPAGTQPATPAPPHDKTAPSACCTTESAPAGTCTATSNPARDLTKQAPHSPRERLAGFVIARRAMDKCRSTLAGKAGEYHFDCPLDNQLFTFKGITGSQFQAAVQAAPNDEAVGVWLLAHGTAKTTAEIKTWSDETEAGNPMKNPEKREHFVAECTRLGLKPDSTTTFDWLEADDRAMGRTLPI